MFYSCLIKVIPHNANDVLWQCFLSEVVVCGHLFPLAVRIGEGVEGVVVADYYFLKSVLKVGFPLKVIISIVPVYVRQVATQSLSIY